LLIYGVALLLIDSVTLLPLHLSTLLLVDGVALLLIDGAALLLVHGVALLLIDGVALLLVDSVALLFVDSPAALAAAATTAARPIVAGWGAGGLLVPLAVIPLGRPLHPHQPLERLTAGQRSGESLHDQAGSQDDHDGGPHVVEI